MMSLARFNTTRTFSIAAACVALNLIGGKLASMLALPVYLDTIGTILAAALLHPLVAVVVGVTTSVLGWVFIHPAYIFYAGTQLTIALIASVAVHWGAFRSPWTAVLTGFVLAAAAALVSAPVTVLLFGGVTVPGATAINAVLIAAGQNLWRAVLTGSAFVEALDKPAAALIAWLLLKRLPRRLVSHAG